MASLQRNVGVAVGFTWVLATLACKQILGLEERRELIDAGTSNPMTGDSGPDAKPPEPVQSKCGSVMHPSQTCPDCMGQNCCDEAAECHGDSSCDVAFECLFKCGDDGACRARCSQFYSR